MPACLVGLAALTALPTIHYVGSILQCGFILFEKRKLKLNGEFGEDMHCP